MRYRIDALNLVGRWVVWTEMDRVPWGTVWYRRALAHPDVRSVRVFDRVAKRFINPKQENDNATATRIPD